jgi:hypothetical protein
MDITINTNYMTATELALLVTVLKGTESGKANSVLVANVGKKHAAALVAEAVTAVDSMRDVETIE